MKSAPKKAAPKKKGVNLYLRTDLIPELEKHLAYGESPSQIVEDLLAKEIKKRGGDTSDGKKAE